MQCGLARHSDLQTLTPPCFRNTHRNLETTTTAKQGKVVETLKTWETRDNALIDFDL